MTFNTKHFPPEAVDTWGIDVQSPDEFLVHQFDLVPDDKIKAILSERTRGRQKPPMASVAGILAALSRDVPGFVNKVRVKL